MEQIFEKPKLPTEILVFLNTLPWSAFPLKNAPSGLLLCGYLIQELARVMEKNRKRRDAKCKINKQTSTVRGSKSGEFPCLGVEFCLFFLYKFTSL